MRKIFQKFVKGYAVLEEVHSPINGKIQVWEDWFGKKKLMVGGISQSGDLVEKLWREGLKLVMSYELRVTSCLILGLGAGSAVKIINQYFPEAKITGVEIDSEVVRLGRKYFNLGQYENLEIRIGDAFQISSVLNYDLILVDMYLGDQVPIAVEDESFLKNLKQSINKNGTVIFNCLYYGKKRKKTDDFGEKLKKFFPKIEAKSVKTNKLFLCLNIGANRTS